MITSFEKQLQRLGFQTPNYKEFYKEDCSQIEQKAFDKDGLLQALPAAFYEQFSENKVMNFMYNHGIYVVPTLELIEFLKNHMEGTTIEIGAGTGGIGRALGIKMTDSKQQNENHIKLYYAIGKTPPIKYPYDVEKLDAKLAIQKYKPDTVIGCFVTHRFSEKNKTGMMNGIDEYWVLKNVRKYIVVGNEFTHKDKLIRASKPHKTYELKGLITRGIDQSLNRIWIFEN